MALRVFTTVRRWRVFDPVIESLLGAVFVGAWWFGPFVVGPLVAVLLRAFGVPSEFSNLAGVGAGVLTLIGASVYLSQVDDWIRRKALQPAVNRGTLTLGDDGLLLAGLFLSRFIPYATVEGISVGDGGYVLVRRHGARPVRFRVGDTSAVFEAVSERLSASRQRDPAPPVSSLREASSGLANWIDRARNVIAGGYRDEIATPEALMRVAEDPASDAEQRIGAALALADAPEPMRVRVRVAAEAAARPHVGEAMTQAIDGDVDVGVLKRALSG